MADPRLNSIHLEPPRRQEYRRAREALLNARGWQTIVAEKGTGDARPPDSNTVIQDPHKAPPTGLKFWLVDKDFIYPLKLGVNTIGRSPDNDVVLADSYVSRRHCAVLVHATDHCELYDTASKNGTYVNGQKLTGPTRLNPGDEIRMCDRQLIFMAKDGPEDSPPNNVTLTS